MIFLYLTIIAITLFFIHYLTKFSYWKRKGIKGPTPLPFFGNTLEIFLHDIRDLDLARKNKYGNVYGIYMGTIPMMVVCDPQMVKTICIKEAQNFTDINLFKMNQVFFKDSFITKKGAEWKAGRNLVTPVFTTKRIKDIYPQIQKAAGPFFENIENLIIEGKQDEIDIKKLAKGYSLDVVGKFVFAFDLNSAKDSNNPFTINTTNITNFKIWKMALFNFLPEWLIVLLNLQILEIDSVNYIGDLVKTLVKQRRTDKNTRYYDFLDLLIRKIDGDNLEVTEDEIIAHVIIFFFAGLETVALTISNTLLCLAEHPEYQDKLFEELTQVYPDGEIEYERLKDSPMLDSVIFESQRLYPVLNRIIRIAENACQIKGVKIAAGERVAINVYNLHMDSEYWFEPEKFYPERWIENGFKAEDENSVHYAPFGSGIRKCVALRMATVQVKYAIAKVLMNYTVYKTSKTKVNFIRNPMSLTYNELILGFKRRTPNNIN